MRAQHAPQLLVAPFRDEVQVELAERGRVPVRVVRDVLRAVVVRRTHTVRARGFVDDALPDTGTRVGKLHRGTVLALRDDRLRERAPRADDPAVGALVHTEHAVRVVVSAVGHGIQEIGGKGGHRASFTCRMCTGSSNAFRRTKL